MYLIPNYFIVKKFVHMIIILTFICACVSVPEWTDIGTTITITEFFLSEATTHTVDKTAFILELR